MLRVYSGKAPLLTSSLKSIAHPALYGLDAEHLVSIDQFLLTQKTAAAFQRLQKHAADSGINIQICSAYRDFHRQMAIWNAKAHGKRVLLDINNQAIDSKCLSENELIDCILTWSALPGASRHHWGTDIDVFDANNIQKADLALITDEYTGNGPCAQLASWLTQHAHEFGFYLPYQPNKSGVSPEPWHLSYYPESSQFMSHYQVESLRQLLSQSEIALQSALLKRLDKLVEEYVFYVAQPPNQ